MSKQIQLDDRVYQRLESVKDDSESFSDAIERLLGEQSFSDLRDVFDDNQVNEMRAAIEETTAEPDR
jgi:predicted CopG family antitoxin